MSDIPRQHLNEEELEPETDIDEDTKIQSLSLKSAKEARLGVLRTLLKKQRERGNTMSYTENVESQCGKNGPNSIGSGSAKPEDFGIKGGKVELFPFIDESPQVLPTSEDKKPSIENLPSVAPDTSLDSTSPIFEIIVSPSMSLLDDSANHMFDLMKGLHANAPDSTVKSYDPDKVNAACNCAKQIYSMMRLKLDALKFERDLLKGNKK